MENSWVTYYNRIRWRWRDVRNDDKMETSPYFNKKSKYLESQLERENSSLRNITETALTKVKIYRTERADLLEEKEELKIDIEEKNEELLYLKQKLKKLQYENEKMSERNRQLEDITHFEKRVIKTFKQKQERVSDLGSEKRVQHIEREQQSAELKRNDLPMKNDQKGKDDLTSDLKDQLQMPTKTMNQSRSEKEKIQIPLTEVKNLDHQVKHQQNILDRQSIELTQMCERNKVLENKLNFKDDQLIKTKTQLQQSLKTLRDKEKENDEIVTSLNKRIQHLETEIERRDLKMRDLEVISVHEKTENTKEKALRKDIREKEDRICELKEELQQTLTNARKTEAVMKDTIMSLQNKIQHLEIKLQRCELKGNDVNERQMKIDLKEKDDLISDLKDQLKTPTKTMHQSQSEKDRFIESLKKRIQILETKVKSFDLKANHLVEEIDTYRIELTQMCERNKVLENTVGVKDDQLNKTKIQQQHSLKTLRDKEKEIDEIVTSFGTEIERRDLKMREFEVMLAHEKTENTKENALRKDIREKEDTICELKEKLQQTLTNGWKTEAGMKDNIMSLQMKIKHLEIKVQRCELEGNDVNERQMKKDLKERNDLISDLKDQLEKSREIMHQPRPETEEFIESLKKKIQQLDAEVESLNIQVKQKNEIIDKKTIELRKIYDINKVLENKLNVKDDQLCKAKTELQQSHNTEAEMDGIISSINKKIKRLDTEAERHDKKMKDQEDVLAYEKSRNRKGSDLSQELREKGDMITELKGKLEQTLTKLKKTETELDETQTRLSKAMGNALTDNNPNITDLSDKNRPTKLAERYAELYDNQWTDAFDILQNHIHSEEKIIESLLQILQNVMQFCRTKGEEQLENLEHVLEFSRKTIYLSDLRQSTDEVSRRALSVSSFSKQCIEICWLMMVQDPPMVFAPFVKNGEKLNTDLFKPYATCRTHVDYMVWPALLLHEDGPVLAKGVAKIKIGLQRPPHQT